MGDGSHGGHADSSSTHCGTETVQLLILGSSSFPDCHSQVPVPVPVPVPVHVQAPGCQNGWQNAKMQIATLLNCKLQMEMEMEMENAQFFFAGMGERFKVACGRD